jgi:hypothetical protein
MFWGVTTPVDQEPGDMRVVYQVMIMIVADGGAGIKLELQIRRGDQRGLITISRSAHRNPVLATRSMLRISVLPTSRNK